VNHQAQYQLERVDEDMALTARDLLARIEALVPSRLFGPG
jgi:hypothetical protein